MTDLPPLPKPPADLEPLLDDDELEALTAGLWQGDYRTALTLEHHHFCQLMAYSQARIGQLYVQLEQRMRT